MTAENWTSAYNFCLEKEAVGANSVYCGQSEYNLDNLVDISSIKPYVMTPKYTVCEYKLTSTKYPIIEDETLSIKFDNGKS